MEKQRNNPELTSYPQEKPKGDDTFTRWQIVEYLQCIPLNYRTEEDHELLNKFIYRVMRHFAELDTNWEPFDD